MTSKTKDSTDSYNILIINNNYTSISNKLGLAI